MILRPVKIEKWLQIVHAKRHFNYISAVWSSNHKTPICSRHSLPVLTISKKQKANKNQLNIFNLGVFIS